ncbi:G-type lectin S-receptor-like serine/threonine-protein kinase At5g24080 [Aristolochia californica]|uniref:G-type lectin S-receptor-like serine/threonine-protein kinase At5g24080 n=1 Tax=Aristolochia californica TaxID=171875 RepID=UPI0035DA4A3C
MSDSGNFALYNSDLHSVWETFSHPSDTLLPGQSLTVSQELTTPTSQTQGRGYYSLKMLQQPSSLSLALTYNSPKSDIEADAEEDSAFPPEPYSNYSYWSSPEISNITGEVVAVLDQSGNFGIMYGSDPAGKVYVYKNDDRNHSSSSSVISRVTIESNGNLRLYRWGEINESYQWIPDWAAVSNPCMIAGICGNGVCTLKGSKSNTSCSCLPSASPMPPSGECVSNSSSPPGDCNSSSRSTNSLSSKFKMVSMQQTTYYFSEASVIANYSDISSGPDCGEPCLSDCECVASVYGLSEEKTYCWTLRSMVFGGLQDPSSTLFVKVENNGSLTPKGVDGSPPSEVSNATRQKVVVIPIVVCMSILIALLCVLLYYNIHKSRSDKGNCCVDSRLRVPGAPRNFAYRDLQIATSNFSQLLGVGGFGSVYKGSLLDGTLVAVKKLERILPHGEKEFVTEVTTIGSMHHMNLVRLCGFCSERTHRLLVYEFMSNGSLDKWIFPSYNNRGKLLDWKTRFQIAVGTAQGIAYFHEQCRDRIIHCDIKPENILLDENFYPKISDFGLAKLMGREHSKVVTMVRGTRGYLAPEWVSNRPITVKADVYSYGMLLLEIVGGRRNVDMSLGAEDFYYPGWAFKEMTSGNAMRVADKRLNGKVEEEEVARAMNVAFWCIQEEVWMRPSMGEVVKMLEGSVEMHTAPMPQSVLELVEEGLDHVYLAMKGEFKHHSSFTVDLNTSSQATCSYSTMSPR